MAILQKQSRFSNSPYKNSNTILHINWKKSILTFVQKHTHKKMRVAKTQTHTPMDTWLLIEKLETNTEKIKDI